MDFENIQSMDSIKKYFHPTWRKLISTEVVFRNRGEYNGRDFQRIG